MKWISVKDKKPPLNVIILVYGMAYRSNEFKIHLGEFIQDENNNNIEIISCDINDNEYAIGTYSVTYFTHWMLVPSSTLGVKDERDYVNCPKHDRECDEKACINKYKKD